MVISFLNKELKTGSFDLNLESLTKKNNCKGILKIDIKPKERLDTLILDKNPSELISFKSPLKIESLHPITSGVLKFEPHNSDPKMISVVRILYVK